MSEEPVELHETEPQVLRWILRNTVGVSESSTDLHVLDRRHLVDDAVPRLRIVGDAPVRIQKLMRQFQVVALRYAPVCFHQCGQLSPGLGRQALVIDYIDLAEPHNGTGA